MMSAARPQEEAQREQQALLDVYGFTLEALTAQQAAARAACGAYEARRYSKWQQFVAKQQLPTGATLKRYCRKGVPHQLRSWVWWHASGSAATAAAAAPSHYQDCLQAGQQRPAVKQIELDMPRTFPRHAWLSGSEGQAALRDVLTAYAGHNGDVGYCQGMNFLVGLLLLAMDRDCSRCFWLLVVLLEQVLYPGTYAPNLDGCHVEMGCLGQLLQQKQPKLSAHLQELGCEPSLLATDWYLCLFCTSLPAETAARVWDSLFCEGRKVLHRLGLALLQQAAPQIMALDNAGEVLRCMKSFAAGCHDRDQLMAFAFKDIGGLPRSKIAQIQQSEARKVADFLAQRAATRNKKGLKQSIAAAQQLQQQHVGESVQESSSASGERQSTVQQQAYTAAAGAAAALSKVYSSFKGGTQPVAAASGPG